MILALILAQVQALKKKLFRNGFLSSSNSASWRYGGRWLVEVFSFYFLNSHEKTLVLTSRIGHLEVSDNVTQVQKVSFKLFQNNWFILKEIKLFFNLFLFRVDAAWTYIWKIHRESIENKVFLFHLQFMAFCIIINKGNRLILLLEKQEMVLFYFENIYSTFYITVTFITWMLQHFVTFWPTGKLFQYCSNWKNVPKQFQNNLRR